MKYLSTLGALVAILPAVLGQNPGNLGVNSPSMTVCEPVLFTFTGGAPPYYLSFLPAGQPTAPAIKQFPAIQDSQYTWKADLPSGSTFTVSLKDVNGDQAFSGIVTVNSGPDTSCVNSTVSESATGTTAAPGTPTAGSAAASTSGSAASGASTSHPSGSATSASASASHTNAASHGSSISALGVAGLMGLVGAALF